MTGVGRTCFAALGTIVVAALGWPAVPGQAAAPKDEVVIGISQEPDVLVPGLGGNLAVSSEVIMALFVAGAFWSDELKLVPVQAKEIPTLANGLWKLLPGGKMQVTWHLQPSKWVD